MTEIKFSENRSFQAAWIIYINGLEIPIEAASVNFAIWQFPVLSLFMTPHPILQRIGQEDRMQVPLFYLDEFYEPNNPQFRLLHEFEVIGWGYTSDSRGRQLQLDCVSPLQIFKQMYLSQLAAYKETITSREESGQVVDGGDLSVAETEGKQYTVHKRSYIQRPIDLVIHIFRSILSPVWTQAEKKKTEIA